jgi:hypothetical protein
VQCAVRNGGREESKNQAVRSAAVGGAAMEKFVLCKGIWAREISFKPYLGIKEVNFHYRQRKSEVQLQTKKK